MAVIDTFADFYVEGKRSVVINKRIKLGFDKDGNVSTVIVGRKRYDEKGVA